MDFSSKPLASLPTETTPDAIAAALGVARSAVLDAQLALNDMLVRLDKSAFSTLKPNFQRLAAIDPG